MSAKAGALRTIARVVRGTSTSDGAGVKLKRAVGSRAVPELDPFLLLDEFKSDERDDYIRGFPDHPHRGFETVSYILHGSLEHKDHSGNSGLLVAGSVQWMTAGSGIIHSEMPMQDDGLIWGFQVWVNLPAKDKMCPPRYQDIPPEDVPEVSLSDGVGKVRVVAGSFQGVRGPVKDIVCNPTFLDVRLEAASCVTESDSVASLPPNFEESVPAKQNVCGYVYEGNVSFKDETDKWQAVEAGHLVIFSLTDEEASVVARSENGGKFILLAATPLGEPIARHGPFVMNTREELEQAFLELQLGTFLKH